MNEVQLMNMVPGCWKYKNYDNIIRQKCFNSYKETILLSIISYSQLETRSLDLKSNIIYIKLHKIYFNSLKSKFRYYW